MNVKDTLNRTKEFVADHKVAVTATATAVVTTAVMVKLNRGAIRQFNDFLIEKGLVDEFYNGTNV